MNFDDCYELGNVVKTHGLNGEITIFLDVDDPSEYKKLESVFVDLNGKLVPFFIDSFLLQKQDRAIVGLEDVDDLDTAKSLVGCSLYLPLNQLPPLRDDQYYFHELVGYEVYDNSALLGKVTTIYELPQNNLLAVDHEGIEVLIPMEDGIIVKVDQRDKKILTELPNGLLDIYKE